MIYNNPGASNAFTAGNNSTATNITTDYLPDVIAKVAFDPGWGHYEAFALNRWFRSRDIVAGAQQNVKSTGQGLRREHHPAAGPENARLPGRHPRRQGYRPLWLGAVAGCHGECEHPRAHTAARHAGVAGHGLPPRPALTTYVYAGKEMVDKQSYDVTVAGKVYGYGYGDSSFVNTGCETEAVGTCAANTSQVLSGTVGGWWKFYQGSLGNAQVGVSDTYVKREIFSGVGGDPNTNINIVLVSFRYYPFQK